jgi:LytS/YehU family sensor histidine kinase
MQAAELERIAAAKQTVESELQAMQARVEPQFLFNTLARVKQLYRLDPAQAEPMLDEFISYLRAAMPRMRDTSSTIRQEIELVRAYLGIVRFQVDLHLEFEFETPDGLAEARMPAMMLLPLVEQAIAHRFSRRQAAGALCIRLVRADDRIRVEISDSGDSDSSGNEGQSIAGIRERLVTLFGTAASLILQRGDGGSSKAILEIPLEAAPECSHASGDAPALAAT